MNSPLLAGARLKIKRGHKRLSELHAAEVALNDPTGDRVVVDYDPQEGCHTASILIRELPSAELSLTLGEVVHSLRGALEYLIWQLAWKAKDREPTKDEARQIQFPICDKPAWFKGSKVLAHIEDEAAEELAIFQPYASKPRRDIDPALLAILRELSNQDKHRLIIASVHGIGPTKGAIMASNPLTKSFRLESIPYDEGSVQPLAPFRIPFTRIYTDPSEVAANTEFEVKKQPAVRVLFGSKMGDTALDELDALADCVEFIVAAFDGRFIDA